MGRVRLSPTVHVSGWYRLALVVLRPIMVTSTRHDWRGAENLRVDGGLAPGVVIAANHLSWFDPLVLAHYLYDNGRLPRFLAKESIFRVKPLIGRLVAGAGQIPVHRGTSDAVNSLRSAVAAAAAGETVVIYPEATVTREPGLWPMAGKTGAVRIALASGAPLIPVAQWGAHEVMRPYTAEFRLFPRKVMHVWAGPPVDLDDLRGTDPDDAALEAATDRVMDAITSMLEQIRHDVAPRPRFVNQNRPGERPKIVRGRKAG